MQRGIVIIVTLCVVLLYLGACHLANQGYGYTGHNGYSNNASFFYFNSSTAYTEKPNIRSGSLGGRRGGTGMSGGK